MESLKNQKRRKNTTRSRSDQIQGNGVNTGKKRRYRRIKKEQRCRNFVLFESGKMDLNKLMASFNHQCSTLVGQWINLGLRHIGPVTDYIENHSKLKKHLTFGRFEKWQ